MKKKSKAKDRRLSVPAVSSYITCKLSAWLEDGVATRLRLLQLLSTQLQRNPTTCGEKVCVGGVS